MSESNEESGAEDLDLSKSTSLSPTRIEPTPYIQLVLTDNDGEVRGVLPIGENPHLARLLSMAADMPDYPVTRHEDSPFALGQDLYSVSRDYVFALRGAFFNNSWSDMERLGELIPQTANCTFVVIR